MEKLLQSFLFFHYLERILTQNEKKLKELKKKKKKIGKFNFFFF